GSEHAARLALRGSAVGEREKPEFGSHGGGFGEQDLPAVRRETKVDRAEGPLPLEQDGFILARRSAWRRGDPELGLLLVFLPGQQPEDKCLSIRGRRSIAILALKHQGGLAAGAAHRPDTAIDDVVETGAIGGPEEGPGVRAGDQDRNQ